VTSGQCQPQGTQGLPAWPFGPTPGPTQGRGAEGRLNAAVAEGGLAWGSCSKKPHGGTGGTACSRSGSVPCLPPAPPPSMVPVAGMGSSRAHGAGWKQGKRLGGHWGPAAGTASCGGAAGVRGSAARPREPHCLHGAGEHDPQDGQGTRTWISMAPVTDSAGLMTG
jgi:hypothetical protein